MRRSTVLSHPLPWGVPDFKYETLTCGGLSMYSDGAMNSIVDDWKKNVKVRLHLRRADPENAGDRSQQRL